MKRLYIAVCLAILLFAVPCWPQGYSSGPHSSGGGTQTASNCNQAQYFPIGVLCQDTDDGKLYKGTGAAVVEIAAGSSGDVTAAATSQNWGDGTGPVVWTYLVTGTDPTITVTAGAFTLNTTLALGANNITTTGSLGATGAGKLTKGWFTDIESTNYPTVNGNVVFNQAVTSTSNPAFSTINIVGDNALSLGTSRTYNGKATFKSGTALNDYYFLIQGGNFGANLGWTLPVAAPAGENYLLRSSTTGVLSYVDPATIGGGGGSVATDTIWDAAGDLVQGTGADTAAKLTKGAAGTLLRAGATSNAYSTSTFADTYAKGTFLYNASANTVASLAHPGAAGYILQTNAADTAAWTLTPSGLTSVGATTFTGALTGTASGNIAKSVIAAAGDVVVGSGAAAATVITKGANNSLFGVSSAGTLGYYSNISSDDSAYQFYSATASKGTLKILLSGSTSGKLMTIASSQTDDRTVTLPDVTGTLQVVNNEKLASFAWDGGASAVATASSKRCTIFPSGATIVGVYAMADASTTSHFHVYQDAYAAGARSTTVTGAVDIGATLGSLDTTLTGWDKSITAADEICISVETNNNAKWLNVIVYGTR